MPARVETHEPRITKVLEHALATVRREKPQHGRRTNAEMGECRTNREPRRGRRDAVVDHHVEHRLFPGQVHRVGERWAHQVRYRRIVGRERSVGWQGQSRRDHLAELEWTVVLVDLDVIGDPDPASVAELRRHARKIQVPGSAKHELEIAHRLERHAHDEPETAGLRLHVRKHRHRGRDLVRERSRWNRERQHTCDGEHSPHLRPHALHADEYSDGATDDNAVWPLDDGDCSIVESQLHDSPHGAVDDTSAYRCHCW